MTIEEPQSLGPYGFPGYYIYRDGRIWSSLGRRKSSDGFKILDSTGCTQLRDVNGIHRRKSAKVLAFQLFVVPELREQGFVPIYGGSYYINESGDIYSTMSACKLIWQKVKHYWYVSILGKNMLVHRLVAQTFIPNPCDFKEVDHIDGNKDNNCVTNLRWVDRSLNMKNAYQNGALNQSLTKAFAARGLKFVPKMRCTQVSCKP